MVNDYWKRRFNCVIHELKNDGNYIYCEICDVIFHYENMCECIKCNDRRHFNDRDISFCKICEMYYCDSCYFGVIDDNDICKKCN